MTDTIILKVEFDDSAIDSAQAKIENLIRSAEVAEKVINKHLNAANITNKKKPPCGGSLPEREKMLKTILGKIVTDITELERILTY